MSRLRMTLVANLIFQEKQNFQRWKLILTCISYGNRFLYSGVEPRTVGEMKSSLFSFRVDFYYCPEFERHATSGSRVLNGHTYISTHIRNYNLDRIIQFWSKNMWNFRFFQNSLFVDINVIFLKVLPFEINTNPFSYYAFASCYATGLIVFFTLFHANGLKYPGNYPYWPCNLVGRTQNALYHWYRRKPWVEPSHSIKLVVLCLILALQKVPIGTTGP